MRPTADEKEIERIINSMSLEDRIALCSGKNFWETKSFESYGIPSLFMCDGPHGLRKQDTAGLGDLMDINNSRPATCFPAEVTTAASWDPELLEKIGKTIAEEAKDQGSDMVLGPGANLKRNPLCGRNFEYFSEDPYLAGKLAAGFIRGLEEEGVASCLKHFAANSQEKSRFNSDSIMDERTLRELYLTGFESAVKESRPSAVMCAYPKLNGIHCSDHETLLTKILREEWGFEGMVVTDWGAMNDRIEGFRAGCDLNMPGGSAYMEKEVLKAVQEGRLAEEAVSRCAARVLRLVSEHASLEKAYENRKPVSSCSENHSYCKDAGSTPECRCTYDYKEGHQTAKEAAVCGAVLLKNEDHILPLDPEADLAVIGHMAKQMRFQGAGSSHIHPTQISQPMDHFVHAVFAEGCDEQGDTTDTLLAEAAEVAAQAETAIVFAGLPDRYESEGFDRSSMKMPEGHERMIETVSRANPNTVVVLMCGSAVECAWADQVKSVLYLGLPGQAGGEAACDLLYGRANPSGKLTESWPLKYEDCISASFYGKGKDALYLEGIYVGYRYYDKAEKNVRWPFGHGLSYTEFKYSDLVVTQNCTFLNIRNIGTRAGAETVQLYIEAPQDGIHRPLRELKGFQKVFLEFGEETTVSFELTARSFAVWQDGWKIPSGTYRICIGKSSRDIVQAAGLSVSGDPIETPSRQNGSWYETLRGIPQAEDLQTLTSRVYNPEVLKKGSFTMDHTIAEMKDHSLVMKIMYKAMEGVLKKNFKGKDDSGPEFDMMLASSIGSPLRSLQITGGLKDGIMQGLLEMANGHFLKGVRKILKGIF